MNMKFAGGAEEVGRLGMVLETQGKRMLFDYGFLPSNPPKFPMTVDEVDLAFITRLGEDSVSPGADDNATGKYNNS